MVFVIFVNFVIISTFLQQPRETLLKVSHQLLFFAGESIHNKILVALHLKNYANYCSFKARTIKSQI
jgi:hypothetical protein